MRKSKDRLSEAFHFPFKVSSSETKLLPLVVQLLWFIYIYIYKKWCFHKTVNACLIAADLSVPSSYSMDTSD